MNKKFRLVCLMASVLFLCSACSTDSGSYVVQPSDDTSSQPAVVNDIQAGFDTDDLMEQAVIGSGDGTIVFDGSSVTCTGAASASGSTVTISDEGTFIVSGSGTGQIIVECGEKDDVTLVLDDLTLTSNEGPAIWCRLADKLVITLPNGTNTTLTDSTSYPDSGDDNSPNAVICSKESLYINGTGTLNLNALYNNAVYTRDDLYLLECTLNVQSVDDGLVGHDSLQLGYGTCVTVNCEGDSFRSTGTDEDQGYIYAADSAVTIDSGTDGFDAASSILIESGSFNITTGGGSGNDSSSDSWGYWGHGSSSGSDNTSSAKAIKAGSSLTITGGTFTINSSDDAIHCNGDAVISGGIFDISSGDDGVHADSGLTLGGCEMTISKSYEGLEANVITIESGKFDITSSDDGLNVAGGNDDSSTNGRQGQNPFENDSTCLLTISGGTLTVNASGDGLDSNGSIAMTGGTVYVSGPTNSGNGALDYGGSFSISGGTLIAVGSYGMAQTTSAGTQASVSGAFYSAVPAGSTLEIRASDGTVILTFTAPKQFQHIIASSPLMSEGDEIRIYVDGELAGTTTASISLSSGSMGGGPQPGGGHPGGGRR